jgi:hypothetical protein
MVGPLDLHLFHNSEMTPAAAGSYHRIMKCAWFVLLITSLTPASHAIAAPVGKTPRVIEMVADADDRFKLPGQKEQILVLKAGEDITLRITAKFGGARGFDGSVHGFFVRELRTQGWTARLKEGTQELHLTAPTKSGEYFIECTVVCGPGHGEMRMKMVVEP